MALDIGITGGIGSGKSLICKIFNCLGVPSYDADSRAKSLMTTDGILVEGIKKEFGSLSYQADGSLNRTFIRSIVFKNREKLNKLNTLVHPRVAIDYNDWLDRHKELPYVIREAALLYESGTAKMLHKTIVVSAPELLRIKRVLKRDPQRTEDEVKRIIDNQMPESEKISKADFVIINDDSQMVIPQVLVLHNQLLGKQIQ